ncbi:KilA-N domain-containing protein [Granulibacter bethesdensis]|uniref:KilA-N domain-containing protein n=1 Tax=Granulibacter bethesdensis TaxID=364410 RepID=UPI00046D93E7|nr:KilA-N domain-containing protein [Granulibacter bethesdensis]
MMQAAQAHTTTLSILNTPIRQDAEGRFCLNDCHKAAGGEKSKQPANFMRLDTTRALAEEIAPSSDVRRGVGIPTGPINVINDGKSNGTYVVKELVYAYGMWISPAFHLRVIRAFDAMMQREQIVPAPAIHLALPLPGQSVESTAIFSQQLLTDIIARAEELALASIPRLQQEILRKVILKLAGDQPIDVKNEYYRTSILRRFKPESDEEDKYLFNTWAWEIVPDLADTRGRDEIEAVIRKVVGRSRKK